MPYQWTLDIFELLSDSAQQHSAAEEEILKEAFPAWLMADGGARLYFGFRVNRRSLQFRERKPKLELKERWGRADEGNRWQGGYRWGSRAVKGVEETCRRLMKDMWRSLRVVAQRNPPSARRAVYFHKCYVSKAANQLWQVPMINEDGKDCSNII